MKPFSEIMRGFSDYMLESRRPSLLWVVILNSFLWAIICLLPDDPIGTRRTTVYMRNVMGGDSWAIVFVMMGLYQSYAHIAHCASNLCKITANAFAAILNIFMLAAIGVSVWPVIPALLPGQIVVTFAACLLFITTEIKTRDHERPTNRGIA
jgi:hypothetical protein